MPFALTLSAYVARRFAVMTIIMILALTGLVALFDFIELLRRAATRTDASFALVLSIAGLRLPYVMLQILPFGILLGGIIAFWRLSRSSELVVARAAGISAWGFLAGPLLVAACLGVLAVTVISPLSAAMFSRAERLDASYLRNAAGPATLAGGRLWLRQADAELDPAGSIILSGRPELGQGHFMLRDVSLWRLSPTGWPLVRVEAPEAQLGDGEWMLRNAVSFGANRQPGPPQTLVLPTQLTPDRIEESFASPDTLSFWALPDFIRILESSGFSGTRHRLHFHSLLSLPLLSVAMALLAAGFSMRQSRRGDVARMLGLGVGAGFSLFLLDKVAEEFGQAGNLPVELAAWAPSAAGLMLALTLLLHLEDG
ncbi:LPS export ABC transporter permease LptG [Roseomonas marmotae]|uniref:LPS export ABC transporter permease LptG n=1 Tax=Roseomonas marmotae TaxID=2768161 RepID=A0ABS3KHL0_9PROT|nr:LPS export ABC transporter permease LptG [Roseomonas marmotae]MBO1076958.1 LPS export ABC transporter permease LptG [Roseomonas marmotae]QTI80048.1 LPS export ABC transporter permease LptG [Roseomonas marmotae]